MRLTLALSAALLLSGPTLAADGTIERDLAQVLGSYRGLVLGKAGLPVSDKKVELGHMQMTFESGVLYPLLGQSNEVLGFLFQGQGLYGYTSQDSSDRKVFALNLQRNAPQLVPNQYTVWDHFESALVFSAAPLIPELDHAAGPPPDGKAVGSFDRIWKRVGQTFLAYDHLAAEARLNGEGRQYVYAEIEGKKETVAWTFDRIRTFDESLVTLRKIQGLDFRFAEVLSVQDVPDIAGHEAIMLRDAKFDLATDDNRSATINTDLTFESMTDGLRVVSLALINNRIERAYDWAKKDNALNVVRVLDEGGSPAPFSHRYHEVLVQLPRQVEKGDRFRLRFETTGEILTCMGGDRDDNYFSLNGLPWFPQPFSYGTSYTFTLKIRTRKPWRPAASGSTVAFRETDDAYELETKSDVPARNAAIIAAPFKVREERIGNVTYRVHGYAMARKELLENLPKLADALLRFYEAKLGPYKYDELDLVEIPSYGFGIAPAGMVLTTTEAYRPRLAFEEEYLSHGVNAILAHEIAHQWFGQRVMPAYASDNWLTESMAEYMAGMAMAALNPDERKVMGWKGMLAAWRGRAKECADVGPIDYANMLGGEKGYGDRQCLLYNRGPLVLHMFRTSVGDQAFYAVMRKLLEASVRPATVDDVKKACQETLRADMSWFWDEWIHKAGVPEVNVVHSLKEEGGKVVLAGRVEQTQDRFIKLIVPLVLDMPGGQRDVRVFVQEQPSQAFRFELAARPTKVSVDPANNNLAVYK